MCFVWCNDFAAAGRHSCAPACLIAVGCRRKCWPGWPRQPRHVCYRAFRFCLQICLGLNSLLSGSIQTIPVPVTQKQQLAWPLCQHLQRSTGILDPLIACWARNSCMQFYAIAMPRRLFRERPSLLQLVSNLNLAGMHMQDILPPRLPTCALPASSHLPRRHKQTTHHWHWGTWGHMGATTAVRAAIPGITGTPGTGIARCTRPAHRIARPLAHR